MAMPDGYNIALFNGHIAAAQSELQSRGAYESHWGVRYCVEAARSHLRHALSYANHARCSARKALCMRVLNWLNAELRRLPV